MPIRKHHNLRGASLTSFRHDKERMSQRRKLMALAASFVVLILLLRTPVEGFLASIAHTAFRPFLLVKESVRDTASSYAYVFSSKKSLLEENTRLSDALDLVAIESFSREALRKENDELKRVLGRYPDRPLAIARVLASPGTSPYDTLVLDMGSSEGVLVGTSVYVDGDFVLGEVTQVFRHSAIATLYSSTGNELSVLVGATSTPTTAYGVGGGNFRIILPKGVDVKEGDLIEVPELASTYLGVVDAVARSAGSSLQEIHFRWPVNISSLRYVYVELPPPQSN
jgi:cell shape-determining protein MreC